MSADLKLAQLAKNASPGPWKVKSEWTGKHSGADVVYASNGQAVCQCDEHDGGYGGGERNVEYIAAASPNVVLGLLTEKQRLLILIEACDRHHATLRAALQEALKGWEYAEGQRGRDFTDEPRISELRKLVES